MKYAVIGANVDALLLALELDEQGHDVVIVELEAEIGMPVDTPGRVLERETLDTYFTAEQQHFLALFENAGEWGCRWEWVTKYLSHAVAQRSITCMPRTRVTNMESTEKGHWLHFTETERSLPQSIEVDHVVQVRETGTDTPGNLQHNLSNKTVRFYQCPMGMWYGGLVVRDDVLGNQTDATITLHRDDGLTEVWWDAPPTWTPKHGFVEIYRSWLPRDVQDLSFEAAVQRARAFASRPL